MRTQPLLLVILALIIVAITLPMPLQAQTATSKEVVLVWSTDTAEPDVQYYQLYAGDADTAMAKFGDPIFFNPNATDAPSTATATYDLEVPAGQVVVKWFTVTAIDTSGNESDMATPVSVTVDNEPPAPPTGLSVTIRIIEVQ